MSVWLLKPSEKFAKEVRFPNCNQLMLHVVTVACEAFPHEAAESVILDFAHRSTLKVIANSVLSAKRQQASVASTKQ